MKTKGILSNYNLRLILCYFLVIASFNNNANSQIIEIIAASCSQEDVQAAIDSANDGDIVIIPACTSSWSSSVNIIGKAITIQGAGEDSTIISVAEVTAFSINGEEGKLFRITELTILFEVDSYDGGIEIRGSCKNWRIDHVKFDSEFFLEGLSVTGLSYGVIDHCVFKNARVLVYPCRSYGIFQDDTAWNIPLSLGTSNAVFVEDCEFIGTVFGNAIDCSGGASYVFRNNNLLNRYCEAHSLQTATDPVFNRATKSVEIYNNTFIADHAEFTINRPIFVRAGTGVIFGNVVDTSNSGLCPPYFTYNGFGSVDNRRSFDVFDPPLLQCDGTNPLDGNEEPNGYPCLDQIGRSTNLGNGYELPQLLEPIYAWDNIMGGQPANIRISDRGLNAVHIKEGRDIFNDIERPGYKPYTYPHPLTQQWPLPGQTDFDNPTVPQNVLAVKVPGEEKISQTSNEVKLTWDASIDIGNSGLAGYFIWVNNKKVTSNSDTSYREYVVRGLKPGENYSFAVSAFDKAGNESEPSEAITGIRTSDKSLQNNCNVYPNPFKNSATIEYSLPEASEVKIVLYDLTGRKIENLYSGYQNSGIHTLSINVNDLNPGIYFYKMKTGKYEVIRKCIKIK